MIFPAALIETLARFHDDFLVFDDFHHISMIFIDFLGICWHLFVNYWLNFWLKFVN